MKKVLVLVLSLVLLLGIAVPGTLAMAADPKAESTAATTEATVPATTAETTTATVETTAPAATVETTAPAGETKSQTAETVSAAQSTAATTAATEPTTPAATEETKAPETPAHIETCSDTCTTEGCKCPCHLYNKLMAAKSIEEMDAIFVATDDALLDALSDEQWEQIDAHFAEIAPAPIPALPTYDDAPVTSEIVYVTKNYDNVAPFVGDAD